MISELKVKTVMNPEVISISPENSLAEAWEIFKRNNISGAPVVDEDGRLRGVLSYTDIAREAMAEGTHDFPMNTFYYGEPFAGVLAEGHSLDRFREISVEMRMTTSVISADPEDSVSSVAAIMRSRGIHRVIVARDSEVLGIVSSLDLLSILENN